MPHLPPLTILEEFLLLTLDDQAGEFWPVPRSILDCGTACAVLMDLMRYSRIDCDISNLYVTNSSSMYDEILDPVLKTLANAPVGTVRRTFDEIRFFAEEGESLRERAMERLVEHDILKEETRKLLWIFGSSRYPTLGDSTIRALKLRILNVVLGDEIPLPRDIALVGLADACGLFHYLLAPHEQKSAAQRIEQLARMDLLASSLVDVITDVEASIAMASGLR